MDTQDDSRFPFTWVDGKKAKLNECNGVVQSAEPGLGPRYLAKVLKRYPNDFLVGVVKDENQKKPSVAAIVINIQEDKNDVVEACKISARDSSRPLAPSSTDDFQVTGPLLSDPATRTVDMAS